ncbi:Uma2 family endonuclease [Caldicellulosiruptor danielii]|uniref:Uma2 family endonuclease n=1 Tax=Anaerocellum danielii TaxID=1387557 RepID=A0ABZ0TYQ3_9FIRM|nr:Uma2 family endonuclease [Caldicellulosiruptor danielii]WPX08591.1 Uma2 family endonuclease [Caldicellulosiruptor danielii]
MAVVFENEKEKFEFLPDIMVCCSSQKFEGLKYKGIPLLIVEILSYATQHRDRGLKLYVYEKFGVKEYWIVDIANECIEVYSNNINGKYMTYNNYTKGMTIKTINNITILVDDVFGVVK